MKILKDTCAEIRDNGFRIVKKDFGGLCGGCISFKTGKVCIATSQNTIERTFTLLHELRHIQHVNQGLFTPYYDFGRFEGLTVEIAYQAELDCNYYAAQRLVNYGIQVPESWTQYSRTWCYKLVEQRKQGVSRKVKASKL